MSESDIAAAAVMAQFVNRHHIYVDGAIVKVVLREAAPGTARLATDRLAFVMSIAEAKLMASDIMHEVLSSGH